MITFKARYRLPIQLITEYFSFKYYVIIIIEVGAIKPECKIAI